MTTWHVGCPDAWAPEIQRAIADQLPDGFEIEFAPVGSGGVTWRDLLARSDFLLAAAGKLDAEAIGSGSRLRLIQRWGIGYDSVDLEAARRHGVGVAITAGANAHAVAEHAVMLILATLRHLSQVDRALREGRWLFKEMRVRCMQLSGRRVGLLGFGNIGRAVAKTIAGFRSRPRLP